MNFRNGASPIMTENGGEAWAQTIFYPFMHASKYGRGTALQPVIHCDTYEHCNKRKNVPFVESIGVYNDTSLTVFAVTRSLEKEINFEIDLRDFNGYEAVEHIVLEHDDLEAVNTKDNPFNCVPKTQPINEKGTDSLEVTLNKHSWNVIRFVKK